MERNRTKIILAILLFVTCWGIMWAKEFNINRMMMDRNNTVVESMYLVEVGMRVLFRKSTSNWIVILRFIRNFEIPEPLVYDRLDQSWLLSTSTCKNVNYIMRLNAMSMEWMSEQIAVPFPFEKHATSIHLPQSAIYVIILK